MECSQDTTIISTAIPHITKQFHSIQDVGWYGSGYFLTACSFQLLWGRIFVLFNLKWPYVISILIFELGSLICGVAPSSVALIVGRAIAGVGSAGIFSGSFIIVSCSLPIHKRAKFNAILGSMYGIASACGQPIGGAFADHVSWRWCFYINLPLGAVVLFGIIFYLKPVVPNPALIKLPRKQKLAQLDVFGTLVFIGATVCLFIALQWGGVKYDWFNGRIVILLMVFGMAAIAWVWIEHKRGERATLPGRIVRMRSIAAASLSAFTMGGSFFIMLYYVAIWFQAVRSKTAVLSGLLSLPMVGGLTIGILAAGQTQKYVKYIPPYLIASGICASIGAGVIVSWTTKTSQAR